MIKNVDRVCLLSVLSTYMDNNILVMLFTLVLRRKLI